MGANGLKDQNAVSVQLQSALPNPMRNKGLI